MSELLKIATMTTDASITYVNKTMLETLQPYKVAVLLWEILSPIIIVAGTIGNILSLIIFHKMRQDSNEHAISMTYFLSSLALSDLMLLYLGLLRRWLMYVIDFDVRAINGVMCRVHIFLVYLTSMTSSWSLVAMTLQRVTSVLWPHRVQLLCSQRNAKITIAGIVLCLVTIVSPVLLAPFSTVTVSNGVHITHVCFLAPEEWRYYEDIILMWTDLVMSSLLPSLLLLLGNGILGVSLARSVRQARRMMSLANLNAGRHKRTRQQTTSSLTLTLLCLSVTFFVSTMSVCIYFILEGYDIIIAGDDTEGDGWGDLAEAITNLLWYTNAALNFYVYVLTGTKFRARCLATMCPRRHQRFRNSNGHALPSSPFPLPRNATGRAALMSGPFSISMAAAAADLPTITSR